MSSLLKLVEYLVKRLVRCSWCVAKLGVIMKRNTRQKQSIASVPPVHSPFLFGSLFAFMGINSRTMKCRDLKSMYFGASVLKYCGQNGGTFPPRVVLHV